MKSINTALTVPLAELPVRTGKLSQPGGILSIEAASAIRKVSVRKVQIVQSSGLSLKECPDGILRGTCKVSFR